MVRAARQRISGTDAGFLYIETETQTSTCTHTVVLGPPPPGATPLTRAELLARLADRLDRTPRLRRRLAHVPGGIGHAVLVDHPEFDLEAHVRHADLPSGSGEEEFHAFMASQVPLRLPLDRALWQVTLLDGLDDGRQALVFAFHHTLADGAGLLGILSELLEDRADQRPPVVDPREVPRVLAPPRPWLFVTTLLRQLVVWVSLPVLLAVTVRRFRAVRARREVADVRVPAMSSDAPRTVLNTSADRERAYAHTSLSLARVREVRDAAGTTVSDVVLAVVAGAVRGYLADRGQLPEEPLVVNVPVGHDRPDAKPRVGGNVFCNYYAMLPTDEPDPRARLASTAAHTAEAKLQLDLQDRDTLIRWLDRIPPAVAWPAGQKIVAQLREGKVAPDFNLVVSNLRVPGGHWTVCGREVDEIIFSGPVSDGGGLNVTVVGYDDRLVVALQTNPSAVADPAELARRLHEALDELVAAHAVAASPSQTEGQVA